LDVLNGFDFEEKSKLIDGQYHQCGDGIAGIEERDEDGMAVSVIAEGEIGRNPGHNNVARSDEKKGDENGVAGIPECAVVPRHGQCGNRLAILGWHSKPFRKAKDVFGRWWVAVEIHSRRAEVFTSVRICYFGDRCSAYLIDENVSSRRRDARK